MCTGRVGGQVGGDGNDGRWGWVGGQVGVGDGLRF